MEKLDRYMHADDLADSDKWHMVSPVTIQHATMLQKS